MKEATDRGFRRDIEATAANPVAAWTLYLRVAAGMAAALSLLLVVWPAGSASGFALLVYQETSYPDDFTAALDYVRLVHAVLGAVMAGWFMTMYWLAPLVAEERAAWLAVVGGLVVWFVPDTAYSLASGFWENAVLNTVIAVLLLPPLVGLRPARRRVGSVRKTGLPHAGD